MRVYKRKLSLTAIHLTYFIDYLGWSIVFPLFAPLFLEETTFTFLSRFSVDGKTVFYGFFLAVYPLMQFLAAPIIGDFADLVGRKKALLITVGFTFVGYGMTAFSINAGLLTLLFLGRLITGLFSGNLSICLASIADLTSETVNKAKRFGYLSFLGGLAFIGGTFLGGKLTDSSLWSWLDLASPLWFATVLSLINFFFIAFFFYETTKLKQTVKFHIFESIENIVKALETKKAQRLFLIYFFFLFAWTLVFQLSPVLVIKRFDFSRSYIGYLAVFMGLMWALGSGYVNRILMKRFNSVKILETALLLFTFLNCLIGFSHNVYTVVAVLGVCGMIGGVSWPICTGLISSRFSEHMQGKVLGITQSILSLAMGMSSIIGGSIYAVSSATPYILAAVSSLLGVVLYVKFNFRSHL